MVFKSLILTLSLFVTGVPNKIELDKLVDQWHVAAGKNDYNAYFDFMDKGFIFIGTAPNERWNKTDFATFSKPS